MLPAPWTVDVDPEANAWLAAEETAHGGDRQGTSLLNEVVVTATALAAGAPDLPDERDPGMVLCRSGGIVLPHLRRTGTLLVGVERARNGSPFSISDPLSVD